MMVFRRCAMAITVQCWKANRMVFCMRLSVCMSTAAVASSRIRIFVFLSKVLARHSNCRWPILGGRNRTDEWLEKDVCLMAFCLKTEESWCRLVVALCIITNLNSCKLLSGLRVLNIGIKSHQMHVTRHFC